MISKYLDLDLLATAGDIRTPKNNITSDAIPSVGCATIISCESCSGSCMTC